MSIKELFVSFKELISTRCEFWAFQSLLPDSNAGVILKPFNPPY